MNKDKFGVIVQVLSSIGLFFCLVKEVELTFLLINFISFIFGTIICSDLIKSKE